MAAGSFIFAVGSVGCSDSDEAACGGLVIKTVSQANLGFPVGGMRVQVNDGAWATTDAQGEACFETVRGTYSVLVYQPFTIPESGRRADDVWSLINQTENPLTIPVDNNYQPECVVAAEVSGRSRQDSLLAVNAGSGGMLYWPDGKVDYLREPLPDPATVRVFEVDSLTPPVQLFGHGSTTVAIEDGPDDAPCGGQGRLVLQPVQNQPVSGTLNIPAELAGATTRGWFALRFGPEENEPFFPIEFSEDDPSFDLTLPSLEDASVHLTAEVAFEAETDDDFFLLFGERSREERQITPPAAGVQLDFGIPVELLEPAADATVDGPGTVFRWTAVPDADFYALEASCVALVGGERVHRVVYRTIETETTQATLPAIPDLVVPDGATIRCAWSVRWEESTADGHRVATSADRVVTLRALGG